MKTIATTLKAILLTLCAGAVLASCAKEVEDNVAKAVLGTESVLSFPAKSATSKTVTIVSDKEWHITAPEWIIVNPVTGSGTTEVTVTVTDNTDSKGLLEPRQASLIFSGNILRSQFIVTVKQDGDAYRNAEHLTVDKIAALEDGKTFVLDEAVVAALTTAGYVINGNDVNIYVNVASSEVKVGDKVSIKGYKGSVSDVPVINQVDEMTVLSSGTYNYPEPVDISATIATYAAQTIDYIKVSGVVTGKNLTVTVDGVDYAIKQIDCPAELSIDGKPGNKVELTGYSYGIQGAKTIGILTTVMQDNGPAVVPRPEKLLYAEWLFSKDAAQSADYPYYTTFGNIFDGTTLNAAKGEAGYVNANVKGIGKISWNHAEDLSTIDTAGSVKLGIGSTGHPYVTGAWPGDFWLFEATDNYEYPAGTEVHIKFETRLSATGQEYWTLEYFDGAAWQPVSEMQTVTIGGAEIKYNFMPVKSTPNSLVDFTWELAAPCTTMKFRYTCAGNSSKGAPLAAPNGGTCRIAGAEGTSPIFEVTNAPAEGGDDPNAPKLPVAWAVRTAEHNYATTWPLANGSATELGVSGTVNSIVGTGTIWYNNAAGNAADQASGKAKTKLDISDDSPRVTGAWPGDYCEFRVPGTVAKGKKVHIKFETRTSATNPKYWRLQYLDGNTYVDACETHTVTVEGAPVVCTHEMNADGATNIQVEATVKYTSATTQDIVFRFECMSAMGAGGDMLSAPNGGTWRLTVTNKESTEWQPQIDWAL